MPIHKYRPFIETRIALMCMLTFFPENRQPDIDALANGARFNRDGHGYAIVVPATDTDPARLIVRHGLDSDALILQFADDRQAFPSGPALFHSRYGTCGSNDLFNCHPFTVDNDMRTVVAHNGILPDKMQPQKGDLRCDTRMSADDIFATRFGPLTNKRARKQLSKAIGKYNKLVFLTIDPAFKSHYYIINESSGNWWGGIWYSNYDYEAYEPYPVKAYHYTSKNGGTYTSKWWNPTPALPAGEADYTYYAEDCLYCGGKDSIDGELGACSVCLACADCGMEVNNCYCWTPAHKQAAQDDDYYGYDTDPATVRPVTCTPSIDYYERDYGNGPVSTSTGTEWNASTLGLRTPERTNADDRWAFDQ